MGDSAPLAPQRRALELLQMQVIENERSGLRAALRGPSGSGKSWVIRNLAQQWERMGNVSVVAGGEPLLARRSYAPFWIGISAVGPRLSRDRTVIKGASAAGGAVPVIGSLVSFLTELLADNRSRQRRDQALYLSGDEFDILCHLNALARGRRLLLIADDLQYWDQDSLQFLLLIISGKLIDAFSFLAEIRLVVVLTDGQTGQSATAITDVLTHLALAQPIHLEPISVGETTAALRLFGYDPALEERQVELLHMVSGGHLELLRQLAHFLNANPNCPGLDSLIRNTGSSAEKFLGSILVRRLVDAGENGRTALAALEAASVIGKSFTSDELKCLLKSTGIDPDQCMRTAQNMGLLAVNGDGFSFRHEILRDCLMNYAQERTASMRHAFADCLALLRPFDYFTRAEHLVAAGNAMEAARLFFCGFYKRLRDGNPTPSSLQDQVFQMLRATGQEAGAKVIETAHEMILARHFSDAIRIISDCEQTDHPVFVAERLLLLGLATLQSVTTSERRKAHSILSECVGVRHGEQELEVRAKLTLLTACVHLEMWNEARRLDHEVSVTLSSLQRTDPSAREGLEIQRRKSGMLYGGEVAAERCRRAANYFGPQSDSDWPPRNPVQFFMAQCNLAGNLLVSGRFEEADTAARNALALWSRLPNVKMPRVEKCVNNSVLAGYLAGRLEAHEAASLLQELRDQNTGGVYSRLIRNNCAVFRALAGDTTASLDELHCLSCELDRDGIEDDFYRYFIRSNLASLLHVQGQTEKAWELWCELDEHVPNIPDSDRQFLLDRQRFQLSAFDSVPPGDVLGWNDYLQRRMPEHLGFGWRFYGRGLLLTDTQIWLES